MRQNGVRSNVRFPYGKGGSTKKKKQGYKDRKDESIAMRVRKKERLLNLKQAETNLMEDLEANLKNLEK